MQLFSESQIFPKQDEKRDRGFSLNLAGMFGWLDLSGIKILHELSDFRM
jgi:hypothetical protein